jgi:hypothetical protein
MKDFHNHGNSMEKIMPTKNNYNKKFLSKRGNHPLRRVCTHKNRRLEKK